MTPSINILAELNEISPVVAGISRQLPYQVPAGYFDTLSEAIHERIAKGLLLNGEVGKNNLYQVPEGYFDSLANNVLNRVRSLEASSGREELLHLAPVLNSLDKTMPYSKPNTYFEELPENVVAGIKAVDFVNEELENLSPLMSSLKNKRVYEVPVSYFDTVAGTVVSRIKQQTARVVALQFRKRVMRYAAAAVVTGIMAIGAWMYMGNIPGKPVAEQSAPIVAAATDSIPAELVKILSDAELAGVADNPVFAEPDVTDISLDELASNEAGELLAGVPDEALQQYLEEQSDENAIIN